MFTFFFDSVGLSLYVSNSCISLAYIEMRIILARVLWNFDIRIAEDSLDWMSKQRVYNFWEKGPLNVYLTPVR